MELIRLTSDSDAIQANPDGGLAGYERRGSARLQAGWLHGGKCGRIAGRRRLPVTGDWVVAGAAVVHQHAVKTVETGRRVRHQQPGGRRVDQCHVFGGHRVRVLEELDPLAGLHRGFVAAVVFVVRQPAREHVLHDFVVGIQNARDFQRFVDAILQDDVTPRNGH